MKVNKFAVKYIRKKTSILMFLILNIKIKYKSRNIVEYDASVIGPTLK
jgi:hypothetical protein